MEIPESVEVGGERWRVLWRSSRDPAWRGERAYGVTFYEQREIHLCDSLLLPGQGKKRAEIWLHELCHAALRAVDGLRLSALAEERAVAAIAERLAPVVLPVRLGRSPRRRR